MQGRNRKRQRQWLEEKQGGVGEEERYWFGKRGKIMAGSEAVVGLWGPLRN